MLYFYMSPYKRSLQTYEALASQFSQENIQGCQEEVQLREQDFGNFQVQKITSHLVFPHKRLPSLQQCPKTFQSLVSSSQKFCQSSYIRDVIQQVLLFITCSIHYLYYSFDKWSSSSHSRIGVLCGFITTCCCNAQVVTQQWYTFRIPFLPQSYCFSYISIVSCATSINDHLGLGWTVVFKVIGWGCDAFWGTSIVVLTSINNNDTTWGMICFWAIHSRF